MTAIAPSASIRDELRGSLGGELVTPGDPTYDQLRRVWNGSIDRSPALIARCRRVADVVAAIRFARATGLPVAVRGGGHSYPGHSVCDDGIVIDLGLMKGIRVGLFGGHAIAPLPRMAVGSGRNLHIAGHQLFSRSRVARVRGIAPPEPDVARSLTRRLH